MQFSSIFALPGFTFVANMHVRRIWPPSGPIGGGTVLWLVAVDLRDTSKCVIEGVPTFSIVLSSELMKCRTSAAAAGQAQVRYGILRL